MAGARENPVPPGAVYECAFCERCFSSRQGLAGHMSIHGESKATYIFS